MTAGKCPPSKRMPWDKNLSSTNQQNYHYISTVEQETQSIITQSYKAASRWEPKEKNYPEPSAL